MNHDYDELMMMSRKKEQVRRLFSLPFLSSPHHSLVITSCGTKNTLLWYTRIGIYYYKVTLKLLDTYSTLKCCVVELKLSSFFLCKSFSVGQNVRRTGHEERLFSQLFKMFNSK